MSLGVIVLAHNRFDRVTQLVSNWTKHDCPVAVHIDTLVPEEKFEAFKSSFTSSDSVVFTKRFRCEWGTWGLVAAALASAELLLEQYPEVNHVLLTSGSCLPTKPVPEIKSFLDDNRGTDFIESVNTLDVRWTVGGLQEERFQFYYPFAWRRQRKYFDWFVRFQKRFPRLFTRPQPDDLQLHLGSQWWCLSRETLTKILNDPNREKYERFFRYVWIPDESYFQTLVRKHATSIESRSLTLSKFDYFGRPHLFYDDHLWLLKKSDRFLARKIWPDAEKLYQEFLNPNPEAKVVAVGHSAKIDRVFNDARKRRVQGRAGLYMVSRFPSTGKDAVTARPYNVISGYDDLFSDFNAWLALSTGARVHGHIFSPDNVEFAEQETHFIGAMSNSPWIRDYNVASFLTNFIWNARGEDQVFSIGPRDSRKSWEVLASDRNARISIISGAFFVGLSRLQISFEAAKIKAARLQKREDIFLSILSQPWVSANVTVLPLGEFLEAPRSNLQGLVDGISPKSATRLASLPDFKDLSRLEDFLQRLKNSGINPYLVGDVAIDPALLGGSEERAQGI